ncbi:hypothetical protein N7490_006339 [Penicillium lividum]|nr:hypothetical protein N7490_006339 [Penicillium lividum]
MSYLDLLFALRNIPATQILPSKTSHGTLQNDLRRLISAAASATFGFSRIWPLLTAILARKPDSHIWDCVQNAVTEPTPPPERLPPPSNKPPRSRKRVALRTPRNAIKISTGSSS